jgi:hypothetical protein
MPLSKSGTLADVGEIPSKDMVTMINALISRSRSLVKELCNLLTRAMTGNLLSIES